MGDLGWPPFSPARVKYALLRMATCAMRTRHQTVGTKHFSNFELRISKISDIYSDMLIAAVYSEVLYPRIIGA